MTTVVCTIIILTSLANGKEYRTVVDVAGEVIKESGTGDMLYVNFGPALRKLGAGSAQDVRWINSNSCLYDGQ